MVYASTTALRILMSLATLYACTFTLGCGGETGASSLHAPLAHSLRFWTAPTLLPRWRATPLAAPLTEIAPEIPGLFRAAPAALVESRSLGPTNAGSLKSARPLAPSAGLALRPLTLIRNTMWGTDALVRALGRAAERVSRRWPGSILFVGDLSKPSGGAFRPHASHQNGRDVDLCFYLSDAEGRPADNPAMAKVDAQGRVASPSGTLYFDTGRNWALVQALLEDPHIQVQWIFVADFLRSQLLLEGERQQSPLLERAKKVLVQPKDSSPHSEHFHVRIYCQLEERLEGCLDAPPWHPWIDRYDEAIGQWLQAYIPFLEHPFPEEFEQAVEAVVAMNALDAIPYLAAQFEHPNARIRQMARAGHAFLTNRYTPAGWERFRAREAWD